MSLSDIMPSFNSKVQGVMNEVSAGTAYNNPLTNTLSNQNAGIDNALNILPRPTGLPGDPWTWDKYNALTSSLDTLKIQNTSTDNHVGSMLDSYTSQVNSALQASNIDNIQNNIEVVDQCANFLTNHFGLASGAFDTIIENTGKALFYIPDLVSEGLQALADKSDSITSSISQGAASLWTQIQEETGLKTLTDKINSNYADSSGICGMLSDRCATELAKKTLSKSVLDVLNIPEF